ncbi:MAG: hypothetical protein IKU58_08335 [Clostridia bacterium]|nr:hypothetical protein [Clostridia bacterium]
MKKIIAIMLAACCLLSLAACGSKEADYKLGMGVELSTASSKENNAQVDATVATVVLDANGKIVMCRIDVAQNKMDVTGGAVDTAKTFETKMELGSRYGMEGKVDNNGDGVMKEWDAQAKAFEEYVVGKTAAEVKAIKTQEANGHLIAVDEALLKAGCSMQITDFITAVAKACEDKAAVSFKAAEGFKLGVAAKSTAAESKAASAEGNGSVNMYSDFGAAVVAADGKILAALNDATQPKIAIDTNGAIVEAAFKGTKRELGSAYGMEGKVDNDGNGVMLEWDAQSAAFSAFCVGKTAAQVAGLQTQEAGGHLIAVDKELLEAGCSMQITGLMAVVAQAANYAR